MTDNFIIIDKDLKRFRYKYHSIELLKGIFIFCASLIIFFVSISVIEYLSYLNSSVRRIIFYSSIIFVFLMFIRFILIPLLQILFTKFHISTEKVNGMISKIFPEIKDRLINIYELKNLHRNFYSGEILNASINQKIEEIKPFSFVSAINYKKLQQIGFYLFISFFCCILIYLFNSQIFSDSGKRIIHFNQVFIKPASYNFILLNKDIQVKKGESFQFFLKCEGRDIPQILYISIDGNIFLMKNTGNNLFEYTISSVINPFYFHFTDLKSNSDAYFLKILPKPGINHFKVNVKAPYYTGVGEVNFENSGDLQIASGSIVNWVFSGIDIDSLIMVINDSISLISNKKDNQFLIDYRFFKGSQYKVFIKNKLSEYEIALNYNVEIIPDLYPEIFVNKVADSVQFTRFFFRGNISDDYGFKSLKFNINNLDKDSTFELDIVKSIKTQEFFYIFDFNDIISECKEFAFYFSVTDNDNINGFKTTTSESYVFRFPDKDELFETEKNKMNEILGFINQSETLTNEIKFDLKQLQLDDINNSSTKWEKSQQVDEILNKKDKLENILDQIEKSNELLTNYLNSFQAKKDDIIEKQKEIQDLLDDVMNDELKKLLDEFQKLANDFDSKKFNNLKGRMDFSLEDLGKQLDRNLEMLKKMKVEQYIEQLIDDINSIAQSEETLSKKVDKERDFSEVFLNDSLNFDKVKESRNTLKEILELNKELKKPMNFDEFNNEFENINESFFENQKNLLQKNRKKSVQSLNKTAEELKNLAFSMKQLLDSNRNKQRMENIENLKQILSNLILFSFSEENLIYGLGVIENNDPRIGEYLKKQKQLKEQSIIVSDSLYALATRTSQLSGLINSELLIIRNNLDKSLNELQEGLIQNARVSQQFIMTAVNNLALLLDEALEKLEQDMANAQEGDQECEKPGNKGKMNLGKLKDKGENLKQQLEQMINELKNGGSGKLSKNLSEALMQHEMMQKMLRDMMNNGSVGSGTRKQLQEIDKLLDENRREILNKQISSITINRQNQIMTRLLEAEKAETERDFDKKRESETAKNEFYSNPLRYFEYKENELKGLEFNEKENYQLNNFYNEKLKQYFMNLKNAGK